MDRRHHGATLEFLRLLLHQFHRLLRELPGIPTSYTSTSRKLSEKSPEFQGCTVVSTIHQPSADTFRMFEKVLLLEGGEVCFLGTIPQLEVLLAEVGAPVPEGANVAEFVMDVLEDQVGVLDGGICYGCVGGSSRSSGRPCRRAQTWRNLSWMCWRIK